MKETRRTTDSLESIDIRWLWRQGQLVPGTLIHLLLTKKGESMGNVSFRIEENRVIIGHWFNLDRVEKPVQLTWTDCHYGGKRPWFICPGRDNTRSCGKRVAILYSDEGNFLCRHCYNLTYQSRNESESDRLTRRARKIRDRLGASNDLFRPIGNKPKHMHWNTFETVQMEAMLASARATMAFARSLAAIEENQKKKNAKRIKRALNRLSRG